LGERGEDTVEKKNRSTQHPNEYGGDPGRVLTKKERKIQGPLGGLRKKKRWRKTKGTPKRGKLLGAIKGGKLLASYWQEETRSTMYCLAGGD